MGRWAPSRDLHEVGKQMKLRLYSWSEYTTKDRRGRNAAQDQVFDDTDQDLLIPIFQVRAGELVEVKYRKLEII